MMDLISREEAVNVTWNADNLADACKALRALPTEPINIDEVIEQALSCAVELLNLVAKLEKH